MRTCVNHHPANIVHRVENALLFSLLHGRHGDLLGKLCVAMYVDVVDLHPVLLVDINEQDHIVYRRGVFFLLNIYLDIKKSLIGIIFADDVLGFQDHIVGNILPFHQSDLFTDFVGVRFFDAVELELRKPRPFLKHYIKEDLVVNNFGDGYLYIFEQALFP